MTTDFARGNVLAMAYGVETMGQPFGFAVRGKKLLPRCRHMIDSSRWLPMIWLTVFRAIIPASWHESA